LNDVPAPEPAHAPARHVVCLTKVEQDVSALQNPFPPLLHIGTDPVEDRQFSKYPPVNDPEYCVDEFAVPTGVVGAELTHCSIPDVSPQL